MPQPTAQPRPFSADSAYAFIEKQLAFGPRIPNRPGHSACAEWLVAKFKQFGAEVTVQKAQVRSHTGEVLNIQNIIASFNPAHPDRIFLSAHWDSRPVADEHPGHESEPIPGANDGGSGVAVLLEIARQLGSTPPPIGVDLILWDAEDLGDPDTHIPDTYALGSQYWSKNPHKTGYRARYGINLDMVGAAGATFLREGYSRQYAPELTDRVWQAAHALNHGNFFQFTEGPPITDDHLYVNRLASIPCIDVIDLKLNSAHGGIFFPHWHTLHDDLSSIDRNTLQAVGETMLHVIFGEVPSNP